MKITSTFALSALLASTAVAQPHKPRYQEEAYNLEQRDDSTDGVVWVTQTAFVTQEVGITTTIWVPAGAAATPETAPTSAAASSATPSSAAPSSSSAAAAAPAEFFGRPAAAAVDPPAVPTTFSSVYVAPAAPASSVAPSSAPAAAPVVVPSAPAEVQPVVPALSSAAAPVVPATSAAAPAAASSSSSGSGSSGGSAFQDCTGTSSCKGAGYATFYDTPGADGSCGTSVDGTKTPVVAMSTDIMKALNGANPNTNPLCGASLKIVNTANQKTVTATVYDTCMGCHDGHIDLSHAAWDALADHGASSEGSGTLPVTWSI